jgi:hypothetical protein
VGSALGPEAEPDPHATEPPAAEAEPVAGPLAVEEAPLAAAEAEPAPPAEPQPAPRMGFFARLFGRRRKAVVIVEPEAVAVEPVVEPEREPVAVEPDPEPEPEPVEPEPVAVVAEPEPAAPLGLDDERVHAILTGVLDDLGSAHHRPFSRS